MQGDKRTLALVDALAWPALFAILIVHSPVPMKSFGATLIVFAFLLGWRRVHRALGRGERRKSYRFTTWLIVRVIGVLFAAGLVLKMAVVLT